MDKTTLLRMFLAHGTQINKDALEELERNPDILEHVLKVGKSKLPSVITFEFLKSLIETTQNLSINQLSQTLNYRYEFIQNLLLDKKELVNLVSIKKISEKLKQFSVIGMVFEKAETLILEDQTGQASFIIDKELAKYIVEDEVIGVVCENHAGVNKVTQIIFPDIPFKSENKKTKNRETCFFISDLHMDSPKFNFKYYKNFLNWLEGQKNLNIFVSGGISTIVDDIKKFLSDIPETIRVYYPKNNNATTFKIDNIEIFLSNGMFLQYYINLFNLSPETVIINLLRKRNLNPILTPESFDNSFLIETIPDIIAIGDINKPTSTHYKGTTILTNGSFLTEPIYWVINLQTRETFKINFS